MGINSSVEVDHFEGYPPLVRMVGADSDRWSVLLRHSGFAKDETNRVYAL
jgi:hypothetical protein